MNDFSDRRKYQRCTSTICKVLMSTDGKRWNEIELCDVSAGGLKFTTRRDFEINTKLYFDLFVYNMLSEFNIKLEGRVLRTEMKGDRCNCSIKFENINKYTQVQLDELIKSKVTISHAAQHSHEDGIYTFMFIPRVKSSKVPKYR